MSLSAGVDHLLQRGSIELFLLLSVHLSSHPLHFPLFPRQLQISCWDKNSLFSSFLLPTWPLRSWVEPQTFEKVISLGHQEVKGVPMLVDQLLPLELSREKEERRRWSRAGGVNHNYVGVHERL